MGGTHSFTAIHLTLSQGDDTSGNGGGAIYNLGGTLTLTDSTVSDNSGGGISNGVQVTFVDGTKDYNIGMANLDDSTVSDNGGDGMYNNGTVTLNSSTVSANSGIGIFSQGSVGPEATVALTNSTVSDNVGQGIYSNDGGSVTLTNSSVSGNSAGISLDDVSGSLTNSTISSNSGAGILNGDVVTLTNSTISGNGGGGILNSGVVTLTNSTVAGNSGVGIFGGATLTSSIVANTLDGANCSNNGEPIIDGGYNLDSGGTCGLVLPTDKSGVNPQLGPLQDNGGPTVTMALAPRSPAIDAIPPGTNGCGTTVTTDQRGVPRPQGSGCDMGAYEYEALVYVANADSGPVTAYSANATGPVQPVRSIQNPQNFQTTWDPWGVTFGPSSQLYVQSFLFDATTFVFPEGSSTPGRIFQVNSPDSESIAVDGNGYQYVIGGDDGPVISVAAPGASGNPANLYHVVPVRQFQTDEKAYWLPGRIC